MASDMKFLLPVRSISLDARAAGMLRVEVGDDVFASFRFDVPKDSAEKYPVGSMVELSVVPECDR